MRLKFRFHRFEDATDRVQTCALPSSRRGTHKRTEMARMMDRVADVHVAIAPENRGAPSQRRGHDGVRIGFAVLRRKAPDLSNQTKAAALQDGPHL